MSRSTTRVSLYESLPAGFVEMCEVGGGGRRAPLCCSAAHAGQKEMHFLSSFLDRRRTDWKALQPPEPVLLMQQRSWQKESPACVALAHPFGAMAHPLGAVAHPFGATARPFGATAHPFGAMAHPFGAMAQHLGARALSLHGPSLPSLQQRARPTAPPDKCCHPHLGRTFWQAMPAGVGLTRGKRDPCGTPALRSPADALPYVCKQSRMGFGLSVSFCSWPLLTWFMPAAAGSHNQPMFVPAS
eukprot:1157911-Pelagomonas_calceolata.AAC.2